VSLTLQEARVRAELISEVDTVAHFDVTPLDRYTFDVTINFSCATPGASSFLELVGAQDVSVDGATASYDGQRILLSDLSARNEVRVRASMPYVTDGDGMTAVTDPADGERYVSAYTAMDIAQKVLPCFDQPDLKSTFTVSVTAPSNATVLANGRFDRREGDTWHFRPTPAFSSYIFFFCVGPFVSIEWDEPYALAEGGSLPFGWHARASQEPQLRREIDRLRAITSAAFAYYTSAFDEPYPFEDYQQVFTPGLNWGAMEFPGCVSFRDEYLTPGEPTAVEQAGMNSVIAHEMAHMWFGDLVTFRWWEDSWLNESFADYMGYEVGGRASGTSLWTAAALGRKPTAYRADSRRSTHPIAEDAENLPDVDTAFSNFDMITYAKGNAVLRQLVTWLGEEDFLRGVNRHLSAHPFGNASLADFLGALDSVTERDVRGWADLWLRTTGFDTIAVTREGDVPVLTRLGTRPHRFHVTGFAEDGSVVREELVDLAGDALRLPDFAGLIVVPNSADETYAQLHLDAESRAGLERMLGAIESPLTRALLWSTAVAEVERGVRSAASLVALAGSQLTGDTDPTVFEGASAAVLRTAVTHSRPSELPAVLDKLTELADAVLAAGDPLREAAAARLLARTASDIAVLHDRLERAEDQALRWLLVARLAELGDASAIDPEARRDNTTSGAHAAVRARAALADPAAKATWSERLVSGELTNRELSAAALGLWGTGQADLVAPWIVHAPQELAALAHRSGQAMGKLIAAALPFYPLADSGEEFVSALRASIDAGLPTVAARGFNDHLDDIERARTAHLGQG
jgi:aminopeptidase N